MNMIDKDAVLNMIDSNIEPHTHGAWDSGYNVALGEMKEKIKQMPTIEAEADKDWISVKDRLPPYGERVLVVNEAYEAERGYTKYNCGVTVRNPHLDFTFWGHKVTHWQSLPKPPKEE